MSQYVSRIYMEVKNPEDWQKLYDLNIVQYDLWSELFYELEGKVFYLDGFWSCQEGQLFNFLLEVTFRIPDCIIFADTTDLDAPPYNHILYYLGDNVKTKFIDEHMQEETLIHEPYDWFKRHRVRLTDAQKEYLKSFKFFPD